MGQSENYWCIMHVFILEPLVFEIEYGIPDSPVLE